MIQAGNYPDLFEIDAASRTKVEDTREILDQVQYMPQVGKRKVYLIDEVHMLSQHSFNALLKTLEEPPEHVQFILATTEPEKIPRTILSRCLHFNLQPISLTEIHKHLESALTQDGVRYDVDAIAQIAEAGDGSMRDALSLLDQCLAISPEYISTDITQKLLSTIPNTKIAALLTAIANKNIDTIESLCDEFEQNNIDFRLLLKQLSETIIQISIDQLRAKETELTTLWPDTYVQVLYHMLIQGIKDLTYSPSLKLGALMCLIRMAIFYPDNNQHLNLKATAKATTPNAKAQKNTNTEAQTAISDSASWTELISQMSLTPMLKNIAENCVIKTRNETSWTLLLAPSHKHLLSPQASEKLQKQIQNITSQPIKLNIEIGSSDAKTPATQKADSKNKKDQEAREKISQDPVLNSLLNELNVSEKDLEVSAH